MGKNEETLEGGIGNGEEGPVVVPSDYGAASLRKIGKRGGEHWWEGETEGGKINVEKEE
jgi:hypothetical protein